MFSIDKGKKERQRGTGEEKENPCLQCLCDGITWDAVNCEVLFRSSRRRLRVVLVHRDDYIMSVWKPSAV